MSRSVASVGLLFLCGILLASSSEAAPESRKLTPEWSFTTRSTGDSTPAIAPDGTIYFGTFNRNLWALNPDGTLKWVFRAGLEIASSPAVAADGAVYFGCRDRKFYALSADGKLKWTFPTGAWVDSSPAIASDGTVCFGSWDHFFYALKPDGSKLWQFQTGGPVVSSPAIGADGTIYFGSQDRLFYALNPDGKKKWSFPTGGAILSSPALNTADPLAPADKREGGGCLCFTSLDGFLYALNLDGSLRWKLKTGGITRSSPAIGPDGSIYVGVNQELWAITPEGKQRWPRGMGSAIDATPIAFSDNSVAIVCRDAYANDFDQDRNSLWDVFFFTYGAGSPGVSASGTLYSLAKWNEFWSLPTGVPLARSSWPKFRANPRNTGNVKDANRG